MAIVPFTNDNGKPYQYVSIRTDITAQKQIEEEQINLLESESARIRAEEGVQARDRFVSMAAHELKTPLTSLQLLLEMLLRHGNSGFQTTKMLEAATYQTKRLTNLINDMLDVSRIAAGKLVLNTELIDLTELIRNLLESFQEDFRVAHCEVTFEATHMIQGLWDRSRIEQVVINLLTNAMKYGRGQPIQVIVTQEDYWAKIQVIDHGIGIPLEFQRHLFERFERSKTAETFQGLGLGLWISNQIVSAHQGKIYVESELGNGSTFTVELPKLM
jgi:signal transduction histidine kinase